MASIVAVCNMALSRLGTRARIADPQEDSVEAQHCAIWFDPARDAALRAHDWNFARRYLRLAARAEQLCAAYALRRLHALAGRSRQRYR